MNKEDIIDLFCTLVKIPSPSKNEDKVIDKIAEIFTDFGINARKDNFGNLIAKINPTDTSKKSLLISAHTDVVGDFSPINPNFTDDGRIETDKTRTLGADDKAGVTAAIVCAKKITDNKNFKHGGLEIVFTKDEEKNMTGIRNVDFSTLESEYVIVADGEKLGEIQIAGAGYKHLILKVTSAKSGHSGNDIADKTRQNAAFLLSKIVSEIPQGVFEMNGKYVETSINLGAVAGGGLPCDKPENCGNYLDFICDNAVTNVINKTAAAVYSLRSSNEKSEQNLICKIQKIVDKYNKEYENLATFKLDIHTHIPKFEYSGDDYLIDKAEKAAGNIGLIPNVSSFHAGAETHIYANKKNKNNVAFKPCLFGVADIFDMHSENESVNIDSLIKGCDFLYETFKEFNS